MTSTQQLARYEQEGRQAYEGGIPRYECPYPVMKQPTKRKAWIDGWDRGRRESDPWPLTMDKPV